MLKFFNKITVKLTFLFMISVILVSSLLFFYTFTETKRALKNSVQDELLALAQVVASGINGDVFAKIKEGDEDKPSFLLIRDSLYTAQNSSRDIKFIYTYRYNDDKSVKFVIDAAYGHNPDAAKPGEIYTSITPEMIAGLNSPAVEKTFTTDKWGSLMSGFAPIHTSGGTPVGAVGVDMSSASVISKDTYIGSTFFLIFFAPLLFCLLAIILFSKSIVNDIQKLNKAVKDIDSGAPAVKIDIKRNDEIGELADSLRHISDRKKSPSDGK